MQRQDPLTTHAYALITGGLVPAFVQNRGIDSVTRLGAGSYNLVLSEGLDMNDCIETAIVRGTVLIVEGTVTVTHTPGDDKAKLLAISVAGVAADADVSITFRRVPLN